MKLSVALATYNGAEFIEEQLESIRKQTMPVDEVIICDDQSKDSTVEVVKSYIQKNALEDSWKISVNEKNKGYASNFIGAADLTSGDLIFFCDQDDIWVEDRVERMVLQMQNNPKIKVLGSEFKPFTVDDDAPSVPGWEMKMMKYDDSLEYIEYVPKHIAIGCQGCTMCIRKTFYNEIRPYWYTGWAHDEFVWKLALCARGLYMYHVATLKRRLHSNNVTMHKMRDVAKRIKFLEDLLLSHKATLKYAKDSSMNEKEQMLLKRNIKATELRIELLKNKKYTNTIPLLFKYADCYHKSRAILVELYMAIKA